MCFSLFFLKNMRCQVKQTNEDQCLNILYVLIALTSVHPQFEKLSRKSCIQYRLIGRLGGVTIKCLSKIHVQFEIELFEYIFRCSEGQKQYFMFSIHNLKFYILIHASLTIFFQIQNMTVSQNMIFIYLRAEPDFQNQSFLLNSVSEFGFP